MSTLTITTKGQVTLPAELRKSVGIEPGDKVVIEVEDGEIVVRRSAKSWRDSYRSIPAVEHPVTLEEMTEIAADEHAADWANGTEDN